MAIRMGTAIELDFEEKCIKMRNGSPFKRFACASDIPPHISHEIRNGRFLPHLFAKERLAYNLMGELM